MKAGIIGTGRFAASHTASIKNADRERFLDRLAERVEEYGVRQNICGVTIGAAIRVT